MGERNNKYFLNISKRGHDKKHITAPDTERTEVLSDPNDILNEEKQYYNNLCKSIGPNITDPKLSKFFDKENLPSLSNTAKLQLEECLLKHECLIAPKKMSNNKNPGIDGLTAEFYKYFWSDIEDVVVDSFNYGFQTGRFSISQRRGIISLIPKKNKNLEYLKNWRPLSLRNIDYKTSHKSISKPFGKTTSVPNSLQ